MGNRVRLNVGITMMLMMVLCLIGSHSLAMGEVQASRTQLSDHSVE
jgi:hypothetical protein